MNENGILFKDETHKARYYKLLQDYTNGTADPYRAQLAYLIALTPDTYKHRSWLYDEQERIIKPDGVKADWQTGTTTRLTLLAFNLFTNSTAFCPEEMTSYCTPEHIFCCELAPYFWQAIKIRYPEYIED